MIRPRFSTVIAAGFVLIAALLVFAAVVLDVTARPVAGKTVVTVRLWDEAGRCRLPKVVRGVRPNASRHRGAHQRRVVLDLLHHAAHRRRRRQRRRHLLGLQRLPRRICRQRPPRRHRQSARAQGRVRVGAVGGAAVHPRSKRSGRYRNSPMPVSRCTTTRTCLPPLVSMPPTWRRCAGARAPMTRCARCCSDSPSTPMDTPRAHRLSIRHGCGSGATTPPTTHRAST